MEQTPKTILSGHISEATAYIVQSYPYGFSLRCKARFWLDYNPKKGFRLCSQTTNPKVAGEVWNKVKMSTYQRFGGALYLNEKGHVEWTGCNEYDGINELVPWYKEYGFSMPLDARKFLYAWVLKKLAFEQAKIKGLVTSTTTSTNYGCITNPNFGTPQSSPEVKTEVLSSDYTIEQIAGIVRELSENKPFK